MACCQGYCGPGCGLNKATSKTEAYSGLTVEF